MIKKIVLIGPGCYFFDSFVYFKELGIDVYVLKIPCNLYWNERNYELYSDLGFKSIEVKSLSDNDVEQALSIIEPDENTVFLGGGFYGGDVFIFKDTLKGSDKYQLELLYKISKIQKEQNSGAKCVRYFNGDTGFGSKEELEYFAQKTAYLDVFLFDNNELRDFVFFNLPELRKKDNYICQLEKPLKRFIKLNTHNTRNKFCVLGRFISSVPLNLKEEDIIKFPIKKKIGFFQQNKRYFLSGNRPFNIIKRDRDIFQSSYGNLSFGLSHFYDVFSGSKSVFLNNKDFCFSLLGQKFSYSCLGYDFNKTSYLHPLYYGYTNTANKDINYLMYGIIPVFAHSVNSFNKKLIEKGMALEIENHAQLSDILKMKEEDVLEMKYNIAENIDMFCFEDSAEYILKYFLKKV